MVVHLHGHVSKEESNGYPEAWFLPEKCINCETFAKVPPLCPHVGPLIREPYLGHECSVRAFQHFVYQHVYIPTSSGRNG